MFLVAEALTARQVDLVLSHQTGFPNLSIFLLIFTDDHNRACSATQPGFATVTQQQAACNMQHATCSTKILLAKIKQVEERLYLQGGYNFAILTIRNHY